MPTIIRHCDLKRLTPKGSTQTLRYFFIAGLMLLPACVFASGFNGIDGDTLTTVLEGLVTLLTSTYARLFMVIGVVAVGYLWMWKGSVPAGRALSVLVGIGIVFSAGYLCTLLGVPGV